MALNNDFCEARLGTDWVQTSIDDVLAMEPRPLLWCDECGGRVRVHHEANKGTRAHFEHFERHDGCSLKNGFNGTKKQHPDARQ